jgi:o-succinylbenzoate---CoA ligase
MLFIDFTKNDLPVSDNPYFQKVISFVKNWQAGIEILQIQTSGSTGTPKIIDIKRTQMVASAKLTGDYFGLKAGNQAFCCLNVEYIGGMMMLVRAMEFNLQLTVIEPVSNSFLNVHSDKTIDFTAFVPLQIQTILENEHSRKYLIEKSGLKNVIIGGAAVNDWTLNEISKINIQFYATYGMTETVSHVALKPLNGDAKSDFFQKMQGIELEIDDRNCLKIKGDCTANKWIQTNDIVEFIGNKSFKLLGRADRVVNSGGVKIYLDILEREIEKDVFNHFDKQLRYFLFGKPDEKLGEKLVLMIEAENPKFKPEPKAIFKNSILSKYKIPKTVYFLPKFIQTESGKVDFKRNIELIKPEKFES